MRIAIDYTPALRQGAGIGRYTRNLVMALTEGDHNNRYTLFCAGAAMDQSCLPPNFTARVSAIPPRWLTIAWHRLHLPLPVELLAGDCDLFHSPDFTLPPLRRARGIVTVHDLSFLRVPECADPGLRRYLAQAVPRDVARARRVLADSDNTRRDLIELLHVPPDKISVVTPAVEARFRRETDLCRLVEVRQRYRLPARFVLAVGTLEPRKNFARLISAFAQMRRATGLPYSLVIGGRPGWLYDAIYQQADREGIAEQVIFPGFLDDNDLPALYSLASIFAFPSLYEGFGIPILEAMACGVPVITGDNSSLPEAAGDAALQVDVTDVTALATGMSRMLQDAALCTTMTHRGYAQAARFTWQRSAQDLIAAYEAAAA